MRRYLIGLSALSILWMTPALVRAEMRITRLHCEYQTNPLGIDTRQPRLGWVLESTVRGDRQTACQVLVASSEQILARDRGDLWDTGKLDVEDSLHVVYAGQPLRSGQRVWWKVRVWDVNGRSSPWSRPAWWEMALLEPGEWTGKWICSDKPLPTKDEDFYAEDPAPMFRKEFATGKKIARARAYVAGLGYYELYLNGKRVGDHVLDPGWTTYSKRVLYSTYDVTDLLREGKNAAGAIVGNGWYNPLPLRFWGHINIRKALTLGRPRFILQLNIEYTDGSRDSIVTDETWQLGDSPILKNNLYLGEVYDARKEQPGWNEPGFRGAGILPASSEETAATQGGQDARPPTGWRPVALSTEPVGPLQAQFAPPIKITRTLKPVALKEPKPGVHIFDMGQNFAGWVRLKVNAPAGTAVKLRYGELLYPDGTLNPMTSVAGQIKAKGLGGPGAPDLAYQSETYICKGDGVETYTPRFTFHGFRYVELTGLPDKPTMDAIEGLRLNSNVEPVGTFECSNELFNRIHGIIPWTLLSNLFSVQSDCPHREKFGYGGDIVASSEMALFNFDMAQFYAKAVIDHQDAARPNGGLTETAPFVGIADAGFGEGPGPLEWGSGHPVLLRQLYQYYGNRRLIEEQYDTAKRWVDFLQSQAKDGLIENGLSDHESVVPKPTAVTGTAFYFYNLKLMSELAEILGRTDDARHYAQVAAQVREAFNKRNLKPGTGVYGKELTQAGQAIAFYMGLVPAAEADAAMKALIDNVLTTHKGHLSTGIFGTKFLLNVLSDRGRPDVAYTIVSQKDFPGWGHMVENGATTLWEHWAFSDNTFSHNHPMFGSVDEWFYKVVAGINPAPAARGFDRVYIHPRPGGDLTWAKAEYNSIRGRIRSEWQKEGDTFSLRVTIPPNVRAVVYVPASKGATILESGQPADQAPGVRFQDWKDNAAAYEVGSGQYEFKVRP
ncbi:MAG TPA: family 78 glycoside hydrolase catalytic domain [Phycisphaerae bacterium]|nr:family 78 glycoside hydrolase catalytic domain [Phycisphaerae bacterium]